jgi:hypothetical protein
MRSRMANDRPGFFSSDEKINEEDELSARLV